MTKRFAALIVAALLAGCATYRPGPSSPDSPIDMRDVTITCKASADEPDRQNGCSWEYWADHPTYILFGKDGSTIKLPEAGAAVPAREMVRKQDGTVELK